MGKNSLDQPFRRACPEDSIRRVVDDSVAKLTGHTRQGNARLMYALSEPIIKLCENLLK
jgi:hypothetical protein